MEGSCKCGSGASLKGLQLDCLPAAAGQGKEQAADVLGVSHQNLGRRMSEERHEGLSRPKAQDPRPQSGPLKMGLRRESQRKQGSGKARIDLESFLGCKG